MAEALTKAATEVSSAIVAAFTPKSTAPNTSTGSTGFSPAKVIENRFKCYKQLNDLHHLKMQDLLSEDDYVREKDAIANGIIKEACVK